jgi:hypothetical protein
VELIDQSLFGLWMYDKQIPLPGRPFYQSAAKLHVYAKQHILR